MLSQVAKCGPITGHGILKLLYVIFGHFAAHSSGNIALHVIFIRAFCGLKTSNQCDGHSYWVLDECPLTRACLLSTTLKLDRSVKNIKLQGHLSCPLGSVCFKAVNVTSLVVQESLIRFDACSSMLGHSRNLYLGLWTHSFQRHWCTTYLSWRM